MSNANPTVITDQQAGMAAALAEAKKAAAIGEVPIGAVIVHQERVIARAHNLREHDQDATAHAEVLAIRQACQVLNSWRLVDCQLYVTLEPCPMCAGAIINSRIETVYYGARDPKAGAVDSLAHLLSDPAFNHQPSVVGGLQAASAQTLLQSFFQRIRQRQKHMRQQQREKS